MCPYGTGFVVSVVTKRHLRVTEDGKVLPCRVGPYLATRRLNSAVPVPAGDEGC